MRLFLLPISTRRAMIYCEPLARTTPVAQQSYLDRIVNKANETWVGWEQDSKAPLNWKKRTTDYGNMLFRRIPYEEWGLKSIPPMKRDKEVQDTGKGGEGSPVSGARAVRGTRVEVNFPGLYQDLCSDSAMDILRRLSTERQQLHRRRMWGSLIGLPFTAPVALIPIIPNLPFFYLVFRFYSHWKALSGSKHLDFMLKNNHIHPKPSTALDSLYTAGLLHPIGNASRRTPEPTLDQSRAVANQLRKQIASVASSTAQAASSNTSQASSPEKSSASSNESNNEIMLLRPWNAKQIAEKLRLPGLEVEIERAVEQVEKSIGKSPEALKAEKLALENVARSAGAKAPVK